MTDPRMNITKERPVGNDIAGKIQMQRWQFLQKPRILSGFSCCLIHQTKSVPSKSKFGVGYRLFNYVGRGGWNGNKQNKALWM